MNVCGICSDKRGTFGGVIVGMCYEVFNVVL